MVRKTIIACIMLGVSAPASAGTVPLWLKSSVSKAVRDKLKDPASAQFRWLPHNPDEFGYCAFVNAKNSFGGYTGFVPFYALIPKEDDGTGFAFIAKIADADANSLDSKFVADQCAQRGFNLAMRGED